MHGFPVFWDAIPKRCKGVHCVHLGESFPTRIFLQNLASIQAFNEPCKFCPLSAYRSPRFDNGTLANAAPTNVADRQEAAKIVRDTSDIRLRKEEVLYPLRRPGVQERLDAPGPPAMFILTPS